MWGLEGGDCSGSRKSAGKGLCQEQEPQGALRGWHLRISGKEVCWGTLLFWVCNLGIIFHNTDPCIDFSLALAASYEQMALRNSEVVATQSSERRCNSLLSPAHFLFHFCWARGSSAPSPPPKVTELWFLLRSHREVLIWRGGAALSFLFAWRERWAPEQTPCKPLQQSIPDPWNSSRNIFLPLHCLLEPLCGGFRSLCFA